MFLRDTVEQKLQGYSRKDTVNYYRKIAAQAWSQVEQAGTVDLAANAYDEQLLWLMLDPKPAGTHRNRFQDRLHPTESSMVLVVVMATQHTIQTLLIHQTLTYQLSLVPAPKIPGADFANNIATSVEKTSNNIVANMEKFANAIVPAPPKASHGPAHPKAGCVCACAACACPALAFSCACACAGGGGH